MAQSSAAHDPYLALPKPSARKPIRKTKGWVLFAATVAALGALAFRFAPSDSKPAFKVAPVVRRTVVRVVEATGHLDVTSRVEVSAPAPGRVVQIFAKPGDVVTRGQPLVQLDQEATSFAATGARASARAASSRVAEARATLGAATDVRERMEALAARGLASDGELAGVRATEAKAAAELTGALAAQSAASETVAAAELDHARRTVRAPADGMLLEAPRWSGAVVAPEQGPLAVIGSDPGLLRIDASVAEADIGAIRCGQEAEFTVPAFPDHVFHARVEARASDRESSATAPSYLVTLSAPNSDRALLPGMTATVRIEVARAENVVSVREAALRFAPESAGGVPPRSRVFRLDAGNRIVPVEVSTGVSDAAFTEVVPRDPTTLHAGDRVVIGLPVAGATSADGPGISLGKRP